MTRGKKSRSTKTSGKSGRILNRTVFTGDNLEILRGFPDGFVDLIYLDPPFKSGHNYAAPIGSKAAGAAFKDTWTLSDVDVAWWGEIADTNPALYKVLDMAQDTAGKSAMSYLIYMSIRLLEMRRILKDTGTVYLHCDPVMSHYLKTVMDAIFGRGNFRNEIAWCYSIGGRSKRSFGKKHDVILMYSVGREYQFNSDDPKVRIPRKPGSHMKTVSDEAGRRRQEKTDRMTGKKYLYPLDKVANDYWTDIEQLNRDDSERIGYPTQKPLALCERIIAASSNPGDMVLDPFCGCATACSAAERLDRKWVGIDISPKAYDLVKYRMKSEAGLDRFTRGAGNIIHRRDTPVRKGRRSRNIKDTLYGRQRGICNGCGQHTEYRFMEVDHVVPISKGGPDDDSNLQLLCTHCNKIKGSGTMEELKVRLSDGSI